MFDDGRHLKGFSRIFRYLESRWRRGMICVVIRLSRRVNIDVPPPATDERLTILLTVLKNRKPCSAYNMGKCTAESISQWPSRKPTIQDESTQCVVTVSLHTELLILIMH